MWLPVTSTEALVHFFLLNFSPFMGTNENFEFPYYLSQKFVMESVRTPSESRPGWAAHFILWPTLRSSGFHQRIFFLSQMATVTEIPNWSKQKEKVTVKFSGPTDTATIHPLFLRRKGNYRRGSGKIGKPEDQQYVVRQCSLDVRENAPMNY